MTRADLIDSLARAIPAIEFSGEGKNPRHMRSFSHENLCRFSSGLLDEIERLWLKVVKA